MLDYFLSFVQRKFGRNLQIWRDRFKGVGTKKINILVIITLVIATRLFFSILFQEKAWAKQDDTREIAEAEILDPMEKIRDKEDIKDEKVCAEVIDNKDGEINADHFVKKPEPKKEESSKIENSRIKNILAGSPMEKMTEAISKKEKLTAAFLVGIAKKESDWGRHAPRKGGQDCYNYWGYKGSYKLVQGYSCFDSPEQAVDIVGGRISELNKKGLNTPEKMVVWKCGSSCSWDKPENVRSWIGAVRTYWSKIIS